MALSPSLSLYLSLSLFLSLSLSLSLTEFDCLSSSVKQSSIIQLELSVDSDLHCSDPVVRKAVLLDKVHMVPYPYSRDGA